MGCRKTFLLVILLVILIFGTGCGGGGHESDKGVFFPTHSESDAPSGLLEGTLGRAGSCVVVIASQRPYALPLWPDGYYYQDGAVYDGGGELKSRLSETIRLGGGLVSPAVAKKVTNADVPSDCGKVAPYMVSEVVPD